MARRPAPRTSRRGVPKPKRDYAAEYRRRTAGTAKGSAERQAARGHAPPPGKTEAGARRERELREAKGTTYERRQTRELADRQWKKQEKIGGHSREKVRAFFERVLRDKGYQAIKQIKARLAALTKNRARRVRRAGKLVTVDFAAIDRARNAMDELVDEYPYDDDAWDFFFYH